MRYILFIGIFLSSFITLSFGQNSEMKCIETDQLSLIFTAHTNDKVIFQYFGDKILSDPMQISKEKFNPHCS